MFSADNSLVLVCVCVYNTHKHWHTEQGFDKHRKLLHVVYGGRTKGFKVFISRNQAVEKVDSGF